jgi:hypothetical protein
MQTDNSFEQFVVNIVYGVIEEIMDRKTPIEIINNRIIEITPNRINRDRDTASIGWASVPTPTVTPTVGVNGSGDVDSTSTSINTVQCSPISSPAYSPTSPAYFQPASIVDLSIEHDVKVGEDKGTSALIDCVICTEQVERFTLFCSTCGGGMCADCEVTHWMKTKEKNTYPEMRNGTFGSEFIPYACPFCNANYHYKAEHHEFFDHLKAVHLSFVDDDLDNDVFIIGYRYQRLQTPNPLGHPLGPPSNPRRRPIEGQPEGQPPAQRGRSRMLHIDVPPNATGMSTRACIECNRQRKGCSKHTPSCVRCFRSGKFCDYNR